MIRKIIFLDDIERWNVDDGDEKQVQIWQLLLKNIVKIVRKLSGDQDSIKNYEDIDIVSYYGHQDGDINEVIQIKKWKVTSTGIELKNEGEEIGIQTLIDNVVGNLPEENEENKDEKIYSIIFCDHVWQFFPEENQNIKEQIWNAVKNKRCLLVYYTAADLDGARKFIRTINTAEAPIKCKLCKSVWSVAQDWGDNINNVMATSSNLYNALSRSDIWN